jgi:diguanylate cyclase (GGDEF)-like protein
LILTGAEGGPDGAKIGQALRDLPNLTPLQEQMPRPKTGRYHYESLDGAHLLNVNAIPELNGYLFVDKREDGALIEIRRSLSLNLLICLAVLVLVIYQLNQVIHRFKMRLEAQATLDSLTGLPNRRGFDRIAIDAIKDARSEHRALSAMLLDLDHFKRLNDTHGHLAGDQVLVGFADDVRRCLRDSDIICRWGGEEFIILLKDTSSSGARRVAEKIRLVAEQHTYVFSGSALQVTVSLGLTELQPADTLQSLIGRADKALYSAKQNGRNRVCTEMAEPV